MCVYVSIYISIYIYIYIYRVELILLHGVCGFSHRTLGKLPTSPHQGNQGIPYTTITHFLCGF